MTTFTKKHEEILGKASELIKERDKELSKKTTVNYNFLKELNIQRNERLITRLLKSILEFEFPSLEESTNDNTLLSSFIEEVLLENDEDSIAEFNKLNKSKLSIELEHKITPKIEDEQIYGQIDMVVHYEVSNQDANANKKEYLPLIAIEVKIDAGDQYGQCSRYIQYMDEFKAKRKEHFAFDKLIYLSIKGKNPTDYAFYDKSPDNEIDESLKVTNRAFTPNVRAWLEKVKERYKTYSKIVFGNEEEKEGDGFIIVLNSLIEIIEDWDKGEVFMEKMYSEIIEQKKLVEAIEIAKALQYQFEAQKKIFLDKVAKSLDNKNEINKENFQEKYKGSVIKYFKDKSHHLVWEINQDIYDEKLFLYLGTKGNSEKMYVGVLSENLQGKKEKFLDFESREIISGIEGKYNSADFIWWGNIMVNEEVLSFDTTNLDLLNSKSETYEKYREKTVCIIKSIFESFEKNNS